MAFHYHFEWDPNKAVSNRRKHGIGFEQATTIFTDPLAVSIYDQDHSEEEEHWITLGQSGNGPLLVVSHTYQQTSATEATVRIISARRTTKHEQRDYEHNT